MPNCHCGSSPVRLACCRKYVRPRAAHFVVRANRSFRFVARCRSLDALIQHHRNVRTERQLNLGRFFRREHVLRAVQMRAKPHALVGNFTQFGKTEHLEAAGVGEHGARPRHELVQAAKLPNGFRPRPQVQMISVGENDFSAQLFERFVAQALDSRLRAHRHEKRRLHHAVRRVQNPAPRPSRVSLCCLKRKTHSVIVSGEDERDSHAANHKDRPHAERDCI